MGRQSSEHPRPDSVIMKLWMEHAITSATVDGPERRIPSSRLIEQGQLYLLRRVAIFLSSLTSENPCRKVRLERI